MFVLSFRKKLQFIQIQASYIQNTIHLFFLKEQFYKNTRFIFTQNLRTN